MLYKNKEWLKEQYVDKKLSLERIGELAGVHRQSIRNSLKKFDIKNGTEYSHGKTIYPQLNDKEWLYQKYFIEKLSTPQIMKLVGCVQCNTVRQAIIRFGWTPRNYRDGIIRNTPDNIIINKEFIDGSLLGDAGLYIYNKKSRICRPHLYKKNKHYNHLNWFSKHILPEENIVLKKEIHYLEYKNKQRKYICYVVRTQSSDKLMEYFNRWYPASNNYIKLVPRDVVLTPLTVLNWFLDDGSSTWRDRNKDLDAVENEWIQKKKQVIVQFCSESFSKSDNEFLILKLKEIGLNASLMKVSSGSKYRIRINQSNTNKFFEYIGKCPVKELEYKWKII